MIKKALAIIAGIAAFAALFFRGQSIKNKAESEHQRDRADSASSSVETHHRVNNKVSEIENKHKQEQVDEQEQLDAGRRDHFDNND